MGKWNKVRSGTKYDLYKNRNGTLRRRYKSGTWSAHKKTRSYRRY